MSMAEWPCFEPFTGPADAASGRFARLGTPEDIAAAAVYLSSNEAAYVTGQTIHVNGGMAMI